MILLLFEGYAAIRDLRKPSGVLAVCVSSPGLLRAPSLPPWAGLVVTLKIRSQAVCRQAASIAKAKNAAVAKPVMKGKEASMS
jgi:hypothetical protein